MFGNSAIFLVAGTELCGAPLTKATATQRRSPRTGERTSEATPELRRG
jgi:hypothetical protein